MDRDHYWFVAEQDLEIQNPATDRKLRLRDDAEAPAVLAQGEVLPHDTFDMIGIIERHGAEVSAVISASDADYERYVSHHRHSTLTWAREHPNHPEQREILAKSRADWTYYLRSIRPYLGWSIFVGRKEG